MCCKTWGQNGFASWNLGFDDEWAKVTTNIQPFSGSCSRFHALRYFTIAGHYADNPFPIYQKLVLALNSLWSVEVCFAFSHSGQLWWWNEKNPLYLYHNEGKDIECWTTARTTVTDAKSGCTDNKFFRWLLLIRAIMAYLVIFNLVDDNFMCAHMCARVRVSHSATIQIIYSGVSL